VATQTFDGWLSAEMTRKGVKSARRFGLEMGADPAHVGDWLLGAAMPTDQECDLIARYLNVAAHDVRERRFPQRH